MYRPSLPDSICLFVQMQLQMEVMDLDSCLFIQVICLVACLVAQLRQRLT